MRLTSGILKRFVWGRWSLEVTASGLTYEKGSNPPVTIRLPDIKLIVVEDGLMTQGIKLQGLTAPLKFMGMSATDAKSFVNKAVAHVGSAVASAIQAHESKIRLAEQQFACFNRATFYLNQTKVSELKALLPDELDLFEHPYLQLNLLNPEIQKFAQTYKDFTDPTSTFTQEKNRFYVTRQREKYRELFSNLEKYPLTDEQQEAVVTEEDNTLLIAAAGSGKSSTITAKIAYLLSEGHFSPEQLAVFAFNRETQAELSKRILKACDLIGIDGSKITVNTFHSFSLDVIRTVRGAKPSIAEL